MRWAPNATSGILIAGQNVTANDSMSFNVPVGIFIEENMPTTIEFNYLN
jgi:hypothetical protein